MAEHPGKRSGGRLAFDDVSFEVGYCEVFGFLGPHGAGKPNPGIRHFVMFYLSLASCHPLPGHDAVLSRSQRNT